MRPLSDEEISAIRDLLRSKIKSKVACRNDPLCPYLQRKCCWFVHPPGDQALTPPSTWPAQTPQQQSGMPATDQRCREIYASNRDPTEFTPPNSPISRDCLPAEFKTRAVLHDCEVISSQRLFNRATEQLSRGLKVHAVCFDCQVLTVHHQSPDTLSLQRQAIIYDCQVLSVQLPRRPDDASSKRPTALQRPRPAYQEPGMTAADHEWQEICPFNRTPTETSLPNATMSRDCLPAIVKTRALLHDCQVISLQYSLIRDSEPLSQLKVRAVCLDCQLLTVHHQKPEAISLRRQAVMYDCQVSSVQLSPQPDDNNSKRPRTLQQGHSSIVQHNPYTIPDHRASNRWSVLQDESGCQHSDNFDQYLEVDQTFHWHTEQKRPKFAFRKPNTESPSVLSYRCKDCKTTFQTSTDQVHWFLQRSLHVPKRCEECRRKRNCSVKAKKLDARPMQITEYPHATPKPWPTVAHTQVPKSPSTLSNCSSRTSSSSGITGRFWECRSTLSSTSSKSSSSSLKQPKAYWAISEGTIYDSPLQQEEFFSQKNSCHETSVNKAEQEIINIKDVTTLPHRCPILTSERWADMSNDSGLPTLEAGSSSDCTSVTSLERESHPDPPTPGLSQHSALEHLSLLYRASMTGM